MVTIDLEKHDPKASELVALLNSSDEVLLTMGDVPWAVIRQAPSKAEETPPPIVSVLGMHPDNILYMSEDFNAPLPDESCSKDTGFFA